MGRVTSFSLGEHFTNFVETQVKEGRYGNASDVMRAALRLLDERETHVEALRAAPIEGERSCASTPVNFEAFET
jgi:antitoxin ParD1/3/4